MKYVVEGQRFATIEQAKAYAERIHAKTGAFVGIEKDTETLVTKVAGSQSEGYAQVYKQKPGADIEPGWWAVLHGPWYDPRPVGLHQWNGPYASKREAVKAARAALKAMNG